MPRSYDSNSPQRDKAMPVENDMPFIEALPWRHKFVRLWRFLTRR